MYETMVMLGHKSEAITPIQKKSGIHTHKWKVYVKNSSMMKNVRLELIIEKVRSSMFHVIIRCFKGIISKSTRVQNPLNQNLPDIFIFYFFISLFYIFLHFLKLFSINFLFYYYPLPLPSIGKQVLNLTGWILIAGGFWKCPVLKRHSYAVNIFYS